jgi:hypothetical protein
VTRRRAVELELQKQFSYGLLTTVIAGCRKRDPAALELREFLREFDARFPE